MALDIAKCSDLKLYVTSFDFYLPLYYFIIFSKLSNLKSIILRHFQLFYNKINMCSLVHLVFRMNLNLTSSNTK